MRLTEQNDTWFAEWMRLTRALLPRHMGAPPLDEAALKRAIGEAAVEADTLMHAMEDKPFAIGNDQTRVIVGHWGFSSGTEADSSESDDPGFWVEMLSSPMPSDAGTNILPFRPRRA